MLPLANFSVVTPPPLSSRALFSMVAAASALENGVGSAGRLLVCEKNRGDGGPAVLEVLFEKASGSRVCRGLNLRRVLLDVLSELSDLECFKSFGLFESEGAVCVDGFRKVEVVPLPFSGSLACTLMS